MSAATGSLGAFLEALASTEPVPAGGSAAALAGAAGASLLVMVAGLPGTRAGAGEETADLAAAAAALQSLRRALVDLIDRDRDAYQGVIAARRLDGRTGAQQQARRDAIQAALGGATDAPLETLRASRQALAAAVVVAAHAVPAARSDVRVAVELLMAAARGAASSVDANLVHLTDAALVETVRAERRQIARACAADAAAADERLRRPR